LILEVRTKFKNKHNFHRQDAKSAKKVKRSGLKNHCILFFVVLGELGVLAVKWVLLFCSDL